MVRLNQIYTRTGDDGTSGLIGPDRLAKSDRRFAAMGAVDEANAAIGFARHVGAEDLVTLADIASALSRIQNELFDLGADLANPAAPADDGSLRIIAGQVTQLEQDIDGINALLQPLTSFILPAGSGLASALHMARTGVRRAEREMAALAETSPINPFALAYINRLSDYLFVAARAANHFGQKDVLWVPGASRNGRAGMLNQ